MIHKLQQTRQTARATKLSVGIGAMKCNEIWHIDTSVSGF
jgi:hypothetical protein